jgi:catechol 2,3-dioxygenase-like lactoylglutathione lyase family enzyme
MSDFVPRFGDVADVGHVELFTPKPDESLAFFKSVAGLHETGRAGDSVYLRAWGDYESHTLKLTANRTSASATSDCACATKSTLRFVARLEANGAPGRWAEDIAHGPAYRSGTPAVAARLVAIQEERLPDGAAAMARDRHVVRLVRRDSRSARAGTWFPSGLEARAHDFRHYARSR